MDLNFFAPVAIIQSLLPHFKKQGQGNICVISSIAGLIGFPLGSGYAASKHAIKGYLETLQCELFKTNIHVSIVYPGRINTNISKNALAGNGQQFGNTDENSDAGMSVSVCCNKIISGLKKNQKAILIFVGVVAISVLGYLGFQQFIQEPKEKEAINEMFQAQMYYEQALTATSKDSLFNLSLNGGNGKFGFLEIIENYSGTKAANLANYYAGVAYLNTRNYQQAISYLDEFDGPSGVPPTPFV